MPEAPHIPSHSQGHDHSACIETALSEAEKLCARRGARLTELRRRVLELIWQSHKAVKAYDLLDELGATSKPPTVYRALDFLMEHELVHKLHSLNAYVGCPAPGQAQACRFMICSACETVTEFESQALSEALRAEADALDFSVSGQTIEVFGLCAACQGAQSGQEAVQ